ncbi:MAG: glycosyl transferase family 1 [Nocardioidaceae bacterium]|jgi:trehalose synthase|nr:glycosyl transferase family 1 [Nocardioidaceae bacterium]
MQEVTIEAVPLDRLASLLEEERAARLGDYAERARVLLSGRTVWNVNATTAGGGVAEMLPALLAYCRGAGIEARWLALDGSADFFRLTKRLHNHLHGSNGDGGQVGDDQRAIYEGVLADNLAALAAIVRPGDIVVLHDPQAVGLAAGMREVGAHVVWRCHIGRDTTNVHTDAAWNFLRPYVELSEATIFSRREYAPDWLSEDRLWVIPPSLDPFSTKNRELLRPDVEATLRVAGIVPTRDSRGSAGFVRRDGSLGTVRRHTDLFASGGGLPPDARIVLQVSRWDRLKDMAGVLAGIAGHLSSLPDDVHLVLVGPDTSGVSDDPEGAEVLAECLTIWREQPSAGQRRLHLCTLPMDDIDENAHLVNALQRYAAVVVQKSLAEGFGLTVTEPMWKARPVIASKVGGIQDQITDGESGLLLDDPRDLAAFAALVLEVTQDHYLAERLGAAAKERVRKRFLGDRHLIQYVQLFERLLAD